MKNLQKYIGSAGIVNSIVNNGDGTYLIEYISNQETYLFLADEKDKLILLEGLNIIPQKLNLQLITNGNEVISDSSTVKAILTNVKGTVKWQITGDKDVVSISSTKENIITVTPKKVGVTSLTATLDDGNIDTCETTVTENGDVYKIGTLSPDSMTIVHNEVNFDEPVKNHTTLYAKWEETKYLGATINTEKYGYRVKGYQPAVYNGYWRLFYQDENNTYIIAEPSKESYKPSDYYTSYENGTKVSEEGQRLNFKLKLNGNFFVATNTNNNIKATAWLTDTSSTSLWSLFYKDNVGLASYAIGSPTLELFIESYKSTHPSSAASITVDKNHTNYGYNSISNLDSISTTDNFGMYSSNKAWWIASPQYLNGKYMFNQGDGMVGATDATGNASYSTRPIVCIPTNKFNESCTLTNET